MDIFCVGVPWGGGAFVSISAETSSRGAQKSRAVPHGRKHENVRTKSLGHRAIEWIDTSIKEMGTRCAEFRAHCRSENFFANALLAKMTGTPHLFRVELYEAFVLLEKSVRQGGLDDRLCGPAISQIKDYVEKTEKITRFIKKNGVYSVDGTEKKVETKIFHDRALKIFLDMMEFINKRNQKETIGKSRPCR